MRVTLKEFRYYLRVQGKDDDGIFSMTCIFRFLREPGDSVADIRAQMDGFVARYEAVLDPLFESIIDGEKLPTLRDSPGKTHIMPAIPIRGLQVCLFRFLHATTSTDGTTFAG